MFVRLQPANVTRKVIATAVCAATLALSAEVTDAAIVNIDIGGGWQASFETGTPPLVSINSLGVIGNAVFIQKSAEFVNLNSVDITFTQTSPNAVPNIVIDDEIITNSSGTTWTDFHMELVPVFGTAVFDPVASAGFSVSPFGSSSFTNANHTFNAFNGSLPNNTPWFPGMSSGQLWINVSVTQAAPTSFVLKETPSIPAPATLALLGLAGLVAGGRRRR